MNARMQVALALVVLAGLIAIALVTGLLQINGQGGSVGLQVGACGAYVNVAGDLNGRHLGLYCGGDR